MKRNLFSFPRSQMVGKMLRAMSFVVAVFWATTAMADIVVKGVVADDSGLPIPGANRSKAYVGTGSYFVARNNRSSLLQDER